MRYVALLALLLLGFSANAQGTHGELKPEVLGALREATNVVLYSLDPDQDPGAPSTLARYRVLRSVALDKPSAKSAIAEILPTIEKWTDSTTMCILEPRHGLRVTAKGKDYILLLCYHCGDICLITPTGDEACFHLVGGPDLFNKLLEQNKIPLVP
jgi:hypothetical protein